MDLKKLLRNIKLVIGHASIQTGTGILDPEVTFLISMPNDSQGKLLYKINKEYSWWFFCLIITYNVIPEHDII